MKRTLVWGVWLTTSAFAIALLSQPVGANVQLAMSLAAMAAMIGVWLFWKGPYARFVFLALGSLVVLRYIAWRILSTLPPPSDTANFAVGIVVLMAELYCVFILFVSLVINAEPLRRAPPAPAASEVELPTVDVFVPSYNEDETILATTLAAARLIDYPADRLTVWLLDDGGTDQKRSDPNPAKAAEAQERHVALQALCERLGCRYVTRARNLHAKAGNLNNGLLHATGEIVVVLDADHVPFRSFLRETVGLFADDPRLFLVQTPHAFLNPDPIERNLRTFETMPSENEMFYSITQCGLDKWNGSFFCGSAALLRRQALDEAGGFAGVTITEDCETAFELHSRGWNSAYVDRPLIAGLQPNTLSSFMGQRSRWCQGMMQILLLKNPVLKGGLHPIQKLAYMSSMTFWLFPLPRLVFLFAPLLYIFLDMKFFVANVEESIAYTATYIVINLMLQNYLYGRVRWPYVSEIYEYVQGVYLFRAIVAVVMSPRKPTFNVTSKSDFASEDHLSELTLPYVAIFAILAFGEAFAVWRYVFEPGVNNLMLVVGLWNGFNLLMAGIGLGVVSERRMTEKNPSLAVSRPARLTVGGFSSDVTVERVSADGCTARVAEGFSLGALVDGKTGWLAVESPDPAIVSQPLPVTLSSHRMAGEETVCELAFRPFEARDHFAFATLMYGDAAEMLRFQQRRRAHKALIPGIAQFVYWGATEPFRFARYALRALFARRPAAAVAAPGPKSAQIVAAPAAMPAPAAPVATAPVVRPQQRAVASSPHSVMPPVVAQEMVAVASPEAESLELNDWVRLMLDAENRRVLSGAAETALEEAA